MGRMHASTNAGICVELSASRRRDCEIEVSSESKWLDVGFSEQLQPTNVASETVRHVAPIQYPTDMS